MELNTIQPADGAKHYKRRVGRGIGSGLGKTAGAGERCPRRSIGVAPVRSAHRTSFIVAPDR